MHTPANEKIGKKKNNYFKIYLSSNIYRTVNMFLTIYTPFIDSQLIDFLTKKKA